MFLAAPKLGKDDMKSVMEQITKVFNSRQKLYARFVRKSLRNGSIYFHYPFESVDGDGVIEKALARLDELLSRPLNNLPVDIQNRICEEIPGILQR